MPKIKIGILGAGRFARRRILPHLIGHSSLELVIVHNRSLQKAQDLAKQFQADQATNVEKEVLETPFLDGVIICSPNFLHKSLILKALQKNLAVWVEKPMTLNAQEAHEIYELFPSASLMVGQCYRFKNVLNEAQSHCQQGYLGSIKGLDLHMHMKIPKVDWRATRRYGGGVLLELGVHLIDAVQFLTHQSITQVYALEESLEDDEGTTLPWSIKVMGLTEKRIPFHLSASFDSPYSTGFKITGEKGTLIGKHVFRGEDDQKEKLIFQNLNEEKKQLPLCPQNIFKAELDHFCKVCNGSFTDLSLNQGIKNMQILDAIEKSVYEGLPISIEQPAFT